MTSFSRISRISSFPRIFSFPRFSKISNFFRITSFLGCSYKKNIVLAYYLFLLLCKDNKYFNEKSFWKTFIKLIKVNHFINSKLQKVLENFIYEFIKEIIFLDN